MKVQRVQVGITVFDPEPAADRSAADYAGPIRPASDALQPAALKLAQSLDQRGWDVGENMAMPADCRPVFVNPDPGCGASVPCQRFRHEIDEAPSCFGHV